MNYAILAPSIHNSQPWLFRVFDSTVEVFADRSRALAVVDPEDNALVMSCGTAIESLTQCLTAFGFTYQVSLFPELMDPDLLARITIHEKHLPPVNAQETLTAIRRRHSIRRGFVEKPLNTEFEVACGPDLSWTGLKLLPIVDPAVENVLLDRIQKRDTKNMSDKRFVRESASWMHPLRERSRDGIPQPLGEPDKTGNTWERHLTGDDEPISRTVLLISDSNDSQQWVRAGMKLMSCLIGASRFGVNAAIQSLPSTSTSFRKQVSKIAGTDTIPMLLLRFGKAKRPIITHRRPLVDVLLHPGYRR